MHDPVTLGDDTAFELVAAPDPCPGNCAAIDFLGLKARLQEPA